MKVYISGAMSGIPEWNFPAFYKAEEELLEKGYEVINPARSFIDVTVEEIDSWEQCLKIALKRMLECDAIHTLDGWENSRGANVEVGLAKVLNYPFI